MPVASPVFFQLYLLTYFWKYDQWFWTLRCSLVCHLGRRDWCAVKETCAWRQTAVFAPLAAQTSGNCNPTWEPLCLLQCPPGTPSSRLQACGHSDTLQEAFLATLCKTATCQPSLACTLLHLMMIYYVCVCLFYISTPRIRHWQRSGHGFLVHINNPSGWQILYA